MWYAVKYYMTVESSITSYRLNNKFLWDTSAVRSRAKTYTALNVLKNNSVPPISANLGNNKRLHFSVS